jgi:4-hydroxy-tetrahydrodipicolinate synthase
MSQRTTDPATPTPAPLGRVLTAMVTPMRSDGVLDLDAAAALAGQLVDQGHDGLVVSGTTGESPTTSEAEKDQLLRAVLEAVGGRAVVVAGVGTYDTAQSVELARSAAAAGADGLLVVTPYYSKPSQAGLVAHFSAVADATGLPVMVYDIPGRTGTAIDTETLVRLGEHPRIVAVKDAKGDLFAGSWVMERTDLAFYSGDDALNLAWLTHGGVGVVSVVGHVSGPLQRELVEATARGDLATALAVHRRLLPVVRAVMTRMPGVVAAKAALQLCGVLAERTVRLPLVAADDRELDLLAADLRTSGLLTVGAPAQGG